jgi:hypothetical protein
VTRPPGLCTICTNPRAKHLRPVRSTREPTQSRSGGLSARGPVTLSRVPRAGRSQTSGPRTEVDDPTISSDARKRTLRRRGFERVHRLALTKGGVRVPRGVIELTWSDLYQWLGTHGRRSEWADRLRSYLRTAEARLVHQEYLTEGTPTMFDGFPFSSENPYTYGEARRLLKLAMRELRRDRSLRAFGMDPKARGRGTSHVWWDSWAR